MRFIHPETLEPVIDSGHDYSAYIESIFNSLPDGIHSLLDVIFHDGFLKLVAWDPSTQLLEFELENYVGYGADTKQRVYKIQYQGVSAVEFVDQWPGTAMLAMPPYEPLFCDDSQEPGLNIHRNEIHQIDATHFEHRLMTMAGSVRILYFRNAHVTFTDR